MTESRVRNILGTSKVRGVSRMIREMQPTSAIPENKAWSMTMDDVMNYVLPGNFTRGHSSAISPLGHGSLEAMLKKVVTIQSLLHLLAKISFS